MRKELNILECEPIANKIHRELENLKTIKRLCAIYEGKESGQQSYLKNIIRHCHKYNIEYDLWNINNKQLIKEDIIAINQLYDSIMCIHPFSVKIENLLKESISPEKDVDDFTNKSSFPSCTAEGVLEILNYYNISTVNNHIAIIGRKEGDKVCNLLSNKIHNATISKIHSKTPKTMFNSIISISDVIITSTGSKNVLNVGNIPINTNKVIIDIGRGDVAEELYQYDNLKITPKINGTGLITTNVLMKHILKGV